MGSSREVMTRATLLAAAGIKEIEWPSGWLLVAEPEPHVEPPRRKRRK